MRDNNPDSFTMAGSIVMIRQKTSDLKRRFAERTAERRAAKDEVKLGKLSRNPSIDETSSDVSSTKSSMMNFAIASSTIASSCSSSSVSGGTETRGAAKQYHSDLYHRSSMQTKVIPPNVYKRDIYLATRTAPAKTRDTHSNKETIKKRSGGVMNDIADGRGGIMNDTSKGATDEPEAKTTLPPYSLTGSMLCREMEQGHIRANGGTSANQQMFSPQRPMGLPSNTIMASMLFRTLQQEEEAKSTSHVSLNQYGVPTKSKRKTVPKEVLPSPTNRSEVSELTLHSKESKESSEVDPNMVKASKNLLRILQNNQFREFDKDVKPKRSTLYEA